MNHLLNNQRNNKKVLVLSDLIFERVKAEFRFPSAGVLLRSLAGDLRKYSGIYVREIFQQLKYFGSS